MANFNVTIFINVKSRSSRKNPGPFGPGFDHSALVRSGLDRDLRHTLGRPLDLERMEARRLESGAERCADSGLVLAVVGRARSAGHAGDADDLTGLERAERGDERRIDVGLPTTRHAAHLTGLDHLEQRSRCGLGVGVGVGSHVGPFRRVPGPLPDICNRSRLVD